jgi:hypothetical protein
MENAIDIESRIGEILLANFAKGDFRAANEQLMDLFASMLTEADDSTYMQIINYGLQWGGCNPMKWKIGQDVVDYAKSKHRLFVSSDNNQTPTS